MIVVAENMGRIQTPADSSVPLVAGDLPSVPGGWETRNVAIAGRTIRLTSPRDPDSFLDDPDVHSEHAKNGYMPYWGYIWPAAWDLAQAILTHDWANVSCTFNSPNELRTPETAKGCPTPSTDAQTDVLEIGAGVGLIGLAALAAGLQVIFSDYDPQAVTAALFNARQNGWTHAEGLLLDWHKPLGRKFPLIFGGDVIYERADHEPILNLLDAMLEDDGQCWLADPARRPANAFVTLACRRGYRVEHRALPQYPLSNRKDDVTDLWVLTKTPPLSNRSGTAR